MADELPGAMNLDLNLGPIDHQGDDTGPRLGSVLEESMNLEGWLNVAPVTTRLRDVVRQRRQRWRSVWRQVPVPPETRNIAMEINGVGSLQTGEGSVAAEERPNEGTKTCENNNGYLEEQGLGKKDDEEKGNGDEGSFFDCNICLDLAKDPVVTCCGHLFCWPCVYRWLHIHSDARECPVCKGEVTLKNVTPIYGRGSSTREVEEDPGLKIPQRPQARRIESWRQTIQRTAFAIPMEEMIRRLGSRFDMTRDVVHVQPQNGEGIRGSPERSSSLLNRILTSRGMRREHVPVMPSDDVIDLTENSPTNSDAGGSRRISSLQLRRSNSHRAGSFSNLASALSSAERLVDSYLNQPSERSLEPLQPFDDRDSMSSIAAGIHSESQTVDTAVEIDSNVALSTSSSRRRNDASRISDVDSGDSRAPRRRRLN